MKLATIIGILKVLGILVQFFEGLRDKRAEATVETERARADQLDHEEISKEVNEWRKDS